MPLDAFSVLMSPTFRCNADCEYCFENKTSGVMKLNDFERIVRKLAAYFHEHQVRELKLYWQGGEIFTMEPEWLLRAHDICREIGREKGLSINHSLQSNLLGYGPRWLRVVSEMFDRTVGSSLDFPNLYRKVAGESPKTYNDSWIRRYQAARDDGIEVAVIAVLNEESLRRGAREFYAYFVETHGMHCFQINTPFPGGSLTPAKQGFPLDNHLLSNFYADLFGIWMRSGRPEGVSISPFDELIDHFRTGVDRLSCIWSENCAHDFVGVSPQGNVAQCESWVASYPDFVFGNILARNDMADIMNGPVRRRFLNRPLRLLEEEDCAECEFLAVCHGGCPMRAYSASGTLFTKDPYCVAYKTLFGLARKASIELDRLESTERL